MSEKNRKYKFNWELIGTGPDENGEKPRPSLGETTTLEVYRIFQFAVRDILEQNVGTEKTDEIFREAGVMAGKALFEKYFDGSTDVSDLAKKIQDKFKELSIGIVRFEKVDLDNMVIQLTVDEDLDCSGLPDTEEQICVYDEGLIQGILEAYTGKRFKVREVDCWCSGERTCRFKAELATGQ